MCLYETFELQSFFSYLKRVIGQVRVISPANTFEQHGSWVKSKLNIINRLESFRKNRRVKAIELNKTAELASQENNETP